ncbi:MAG: hypothetical protein Q8K01_14000 [Sulfurimicrobium sp.]|nr:hypothetical protein [Sulfurimicrobium sp.]
MGKPEWILARPLYRFTKFDLKQIPRAKRQQALKLQLDQWSPYASSGVYVTWQGDQAFVWCWDADRVQRAIEASKLNPRHVSIIPESLLYPAMDSGLRINSCLSGFEAQLWRHQRLEQSRWWPQLPTAAEWTLFQRDACLQPQDQIEAIPRTQPLAMLSHPWAKSSGLHGQLEQGWQYERLAVALGVILLALPTLWYGLNLVKLHKAYDMRKSQLGGIQRQAQPVIEARRQALDELARINALHNLGSDPDPLFLMAKVAVMLPGDKAFLKEWDYQSGKLKIAIVLPEPASSSSFVSAFQRDEMFSDVKALASADPKLVLLQMQVSGS